MPYTESTGHPATVQATSPQVIAGAGHRIEMLLDPYGDETVTGTIVRETRNGVIVVDDDGGRWAGNQYEDDPSCQCAECRGEGS